MSWSLALQDGDLTMEGGSFQQVSGGQKLLQDLICWCAEPIGTDDMHTDFGSVFDGGTLPTGEVVPSPIGNPDQQAVQNQIETEVQRIIGLYKVAQLARIRRDNLIYGRSTITPDEVVANIDAIDVSTDMDTMNVQVKVSTYAGQSIGLSFGTG